MTKTDPHPEPRGVFCLLLRAFFRSQRTQESDLKVGACPGAGRGGLGAAETRTRGSRPAYRCPSAPLARVARTQEWAPGRGGRVSSSPPGTAAYCRRRPSPPSSESGCARSRARLPRDSRSRCALTPTKTRGGPLPSEKRHVASI